MTLHSRRRNHLSSPGIATTGLLESALKQMQCKHIYSERERVCVTLRQPMENYNAKKTSKKHSRMCDVKQINGLSK